MEQQIAIGKPAKMPAMEHSKMHHNGMKQDGNPPMDMAGKIITK